ncbi:hypothetical protein SPONL_2035 [uncultured Candidatus Thioglobus sp.]|nr:hypothetical protein SPONL_2035 [uncultured Candidatus Thioglobus sp.]
MQKASVFSDIPKRAHPSFGTPRNILHAKSLEDMLGWIEEHIKFS